MSNVFLAVSLCLSLALLRSLSLCLPLSLNLQPSFSLIVFLARDCCRWPWTGRRAARAAVALAQGYRIRGDLSAAAGEQTAARQDLRRALGTLRDAALRSPDDTAVGRSIHEIRQRLEHLG